MRAHVVIASHVESRQLSRGSTTHTRSRSRWRSCFEIFAACLLKSAETVIFTRGVVRLRNDSVCCRRIFIVLERVGEVEGEVPDSSVVGSPVTRYGRLAAALVAVVETTTVEPGSASKLTALRT